MSPNAGRCCKVTVKMRIDSLFPNHLKSPVTEDCLFIVERFFYLPVRQASKSTCPRSANVNQAVYFVKKMDAGITKQQSFRDKG